ncbi:MAG: hypothetical protein QF595_10520 [Dehalococcoidia bacterium]|nr:hypothetical protein [Dehalococcoidia bacterium]
MHNLLLTERPASAAGRGGVRVAAVVSSQFLDTIDVWTQVLLPTIPPLSEGHLHVFHHPIAPFPGIRYIKWLKSHGPIEIIPIT